MLLLLGNDGDKDADKDDDKGDEKDNEKDTDIDDEMMMMACRHIPTMTKSHHGGEMSEMIKVGICQ